MKFFIIFTLGICLFSCTHMTLNYTARVKGEKKGEALVDFTKTYRTDGRAWGCALTFWAYGGLCWTYSASPLSSDITKIKNDASNELNLAFKNDKWIILEDKVKFINWEHEVLRKYIVFNNYDQNKNGPSVHEFEKSIINKPTKTDIVFSDKETFPSGWPQQWFYETEQYKYWTIVGDKKPDQSEAIISSKNKANNIIKNEFPLSEYKKNVPYETTHTEIKRIEGLYQSWRIIRIKQKDLILLKK